MAPRTATAGAAPTRSAQARPGSRSGGATAGRRAAGGGPDGKRKAAAASRGMAGESFAPKRSRRTGEQAAESITETAVPLSDDVVAMAVGKTLQVMGRRTSGEEVRRLMRRWEKPILKARIPGVASGRPTRAGLEDAKRAVVRFYAKEEALGEESDVVKAFYLATGEKHLRFDWAGAIGRVRRASFDMTCRIDPWTECLAMTSGTTNASSEIYVCGTKKVTKRALSSLLCHEGLHNLARRTRPGNSYISEDLEHLAMAMLGDPQLVHVTE